MRPRNRDLRDETQAAPGGPGSASSVPAEPAPSGDAPSPGAGANGAPGGGSGGDWRALIPESIRGEKVFASFKDPGAFFQSYAEMSKAQGRMVAIPAPDAPPEVWQAFREKTGVPKDSSGYPKPEGAGPNGEAIDEERWAQWTSNAHKIGLTPTQLHGLAVFEAEERARRNAAETQRYAEGHAALKRAWGDLRYNQATTYAERALQRLGTPALNEWLQGLGMGKEGAWVHRIDPDWLTTWANVGNLLAEDSYIEGRVEGLPTAEELDAKIAALTKNPARRAGGREGERLEAELSALRKLKHGTKDLSAR